MWTESAHSFQTFQTLKDLKNFENYFSKKVAAKLEECIKSWKREKYDTFCAKCEIFLLALYENYENNEFTEEDKEQIEQMLIKEDILRKILDVCISGRLYQESYLRTLKLRSAVQFILDEFPRAINEDESYEPLMIKAISSLHSTINGPNFFVGISLDHQFVIPKNIPSTHIWWLGPPTKEEKQEEENVQELPTKMEEEQEENLQELQGQPI